MQEHKKLDTISFHRFKSELSIFFSIRFSFGKFRFDSFFRNCTALPETIFENPLLACIFIIQNFSVFYSAHLGIFIAISHDCSLFIFQNQLLPFWNLDSKKALKISLWVLLFALRTKSIVEIFFLMF